MRKFLTVVGGLTLIVIAVLGIGIGVAIYKGTALDRESKAFVDEAVPAIVATWSRQQLLDLATPELREKLEADNGLFDAFSRLGPLVEYEGAKGQATMSYTTSSGSIVSASYVAKARFKNASATIRIGLTKQDGRWMIHGFYVDSVPGSQPAERI
jgi:hypothetical protein